MRFRQWHRLYGGTWADYMDTPEYVTEMLLRIEPMYAPAPAAPLGDPEPIIT